MENAENDYEALSLVRIHHAIDSVCKAAEEELLPVVRVVGGVESTAGGERESVLVPAKATSRTSSSSSSSSLWRIRRFKNEKGNKSKGQGQRRQLDRNSFGIVVEKNAETNTNTNAESESESARSIRFVAFFYLAYSTWDGRVLYLDQILTQTLGCGIPTINKNYTHTQTITRTEFPSSPELVAPTVVVPCMLIRAILARIAVQLSCSRFTWQQLEQQETETETQQPSQLHDAAAGKNTFTLPPPERLQEWLTLYWPADKMRQFLEESGANNHDDFDDDDDDDNDKNDFEIIPRQAADDSNCKNATQNPTNNGMAGMIVACCNQHNQKNRNKNKNNNISAVSFRLANCFLSLPSTTTSTTYALVLDNRQVHDNKEGTGGAAADDVKDIVRLVQGLAIYEREPDAVHVGAQHYAIDGTASTDTDSDAGTRLFPPLFYCLLLSTTNHIAPHIPQTDPNITPPAATTTTTATQEPPSSYTFGMAFFYTAHTSKIKLIQDDCVDNNNDGVNRNNLDSKGGDDDIPIRPFLFLEDLFLEDSHRGKGAGTTTMTLLAQMALQFHCHEMVWQALDWNTPALQFYQKIGAQVQAGLVTYRYTTTSTNAIASASSPSSTLPSTLHQAAAVPLQNLVD